MLTLHIVDGGSRGLQDATLSIGLLNPEPASGLQLYDFGTDQLRAVYAEQIVAVAETSPARVSFAPELQVQHVAMPMAANRSKVARLPLRRKRIEVPTGFVSGYEVTCVLQPGKRANSICSAKISRQRS